VFERSARLVSAPAPQHAPPDAKPIPAAALAQRLARARSLALAVALLAIASAAAVHEALPAARSSAPVAAHLRGLTRAGLLGLPLAAQGPVSQALGESPSYLVRRTATGLLAESPDQGLSLAFSSSGVSVSSGAAHLGLRLRGIGFGSSLIQLSSATPTAHANRVRYVHPGLEEWYANGPIGLEQGFTIARAPSARGSGPLALALALSGNTHALLARDGNSVAFTRRRSPVLRYGGLAAVDAAGRTLHAWLALARGRLLLNVDTRGAHYPLRIDPLLQQGEKLTAVHGGESGRGLFGFSVALSSDGNTALIGGPADNASKGAAWVFTRTEGKWTQQGEKLTGATGGFGFSVALSSEGNTALIGARGEPPGGAVYVFTRSAGKWTQQGGKLTGGEEIGSGLFGQSVALSSDGNTALIGGPCDGHTEVSTTCVGAVWVFTRSGEKWTQQGAKLTGSGEIERGLFGNAVALSADGNTAVVGGPGDNKEVGAVWVFTRSGEKWNQQGEKLTGEKGVNELFGQSVAVSENGNTALIGAPGGKGAGVTFVFTRSGEKWTQQGKALAGSGAVGGESLFGISVSLSANGNTALIGARRDNGNVGATWVFTRSGEAWSQQGGKLVGGGETGAGQFATAVALSSDGNTALVGGSEDYVGVGAAWAFTRTGENWTQQGEKLTGGDETDTGQLGRSLALSSDGNTALIGGPDDNAKVGAAWVFTRSGGVWSEQAKLTASGESGEGEFGLNVALSSDGNTAVIGGPADNGRVGAAWVFTRSGGKWEQQGGKLTAGGESGKGEFGLGTALSADGNTALIGGPEDNANVGAAWVFTRSGAVWTQQGEKLTGAGEVGKAGFGLGAALSSDGNTALIGGGSDNVGPFEGVGAAWVFTRSGGKWTQQGEKLTGGGEVGKGNFGESVALSSDGNSAVMGGALDNGEVGAAWVFVRSGAKWTQQGEKLTGAGEIGKGEFGFGVALSSDGSTALIGGLGDNGEVGAAWMFTRSGETWSQQGAKVTGSGETGKGFFGWQVALSEDASTALIGGPLDNGSIGAVWVLVSSPAVKTQPATEVKDVSASFNATVNPHGEEVTKCEFEYGTSTAYGKTATCTPAPGKGESSVATSAAIASLSANTVYHFRISATNAKGTNVGADQNFTTLATSATAETKEASKPAKASVGGLSVEASGGTGKVTIGPYGSNIGGPPLIKGTGVYIQVYHATGASFQKIQYTDCELGGAKSIWWENPATGWEAIPEPVAVYKESPGPPCITVTATESTKPSVAQLKDPRHRGGPAGNQEYGKCEPAKRGRYSEGACLTISEKKGKPKGKFEWFPDPVTCFAQKKGRYADPGCTAVSEKKGKPKGKFEKAANTFTGTSGAMKLEIHGSQPLECESSSFQGELIAAKIATETITFSGCHQQSNKCQTPGAQTGTIRTPPLESYTYEEGGKYFAVLAGNPVMSFVCAGAQYTLRGALSGEITRGFNAMGTSSESVFKQSVGEQKLITEDQQGVQEAILTETAVRTDAQATELKTRP
jgi:phage gpG-like protein